MRRATGIAALIALTMSLGTTAQADWLKPSKKDQIKLGQRAADDIRKHETLLPDSDERVRLLRRVGGRLMAEMTPQQSKDWQFSFDVIQSKEINAYALPGGPVFFYTGLIDKFKTEDELAAVLGHEMTHVTKEHWASAYADNTKRQLGIGILLTVLHANRAIFDIASVSDELLFSLPFSRKHESQADDGGFDLMIKAGYNPNAMANVFRMLGSTGGSKPPEFLNTHPDDKNRVKRIEEKVRKENRTWPAERPLPWSSGG